MLTGPATAPAGAVVVPVGNNSGVYWNQPGVTFYFVSGVHTLGGSAYAQIQPANNTSFVGAPGAVLDGQGLDRYAFTAFASGVTIRYLTIENFVAPGNEGVVNHDSGVNWTIQYNTITNNGGAAAVLGPNGVASYNCLSNNGQYGFAAFHSGGPDTNITLDHNEIAGNNTGDWEALDPGCGCSGGGKLWNVVGGAITSNWVHDNAGPGIWADTNNAGLLIDGNYIADNDDEAIIYEISYNAQITNNNILRNGIVQGKSFAAQNPAYPIATIYISESGGDARVDGGLYSTLNIAGNNLVDNWGGVSLYENADRFCSSAANTSSEFCTMVNPAVTLSTCVAGTINNQPYLSDCRWKTQNVSVHDNTFAFSRANVGCTTTGCGEQSIFANVGSTPSWSPYLGNGVNNAITTQQNNHFANNTYTGDWQFAWSNGNPDTFTQWQGAPYNQDTGSTLNGTTIPPPPPGNLIDADTSTLEGSTGHWMTWVSTTIAQSTTQAHSGTHSLKINVTIPNGWGIQVNNWPGFTAAPGPQTISFWGLAGTGTLGATMHANWEDIHGQVLATTTATIATLTTTWQQGTATATAPPGTAYVTVDITSLVGAAGNSLYVDDITAGPTTTSGGNMLDAATSTLEKSTGYWTATAATITRTTAQAQSGTHSLKVKLSAATGWTVQLNNLPGFAATPGPKTLSFWALAGAGTLGVTMQAQWRDTNGTTLATSTTSLPTLTTTWQQATTNITAPAGTAYVSLVLTGTTGFAGNSLFLDDVYVGS